MIPKIIHYCWLSGDPFPPIIQKCINSWKMYLPDYEFILWDTKRFDISSNLWVKQAYEKKKYAFAADYIRLYALYTYGGIYLDSDAQVLKSFNDLLKLPYFIGRDSSGSLEAAIIGCEQKSDWIKLCLDYYDGRTFIDKHNDMDITTLPVVMHNQIQKKYNIVFKDKLEKIDYKLDNNLYLLPFDFFCCKRSSDGKVKTTENSYTIHHFAMTWRSPLSIVLTEMKRLVVIIGGIKFTNLLIRTFSLQHLKNMLDK